MLIEELLEPLARATAACDSRRDVKAPARECDNQSMASLPKRIMVHDPDLEGSYELVERRSDGSLVLRPVTERLSDVLLATADTVFVDAEFAAHLARVAASDDDLPPAEHQ